MFTERNGTDTMATPSKLDSGAPTHHGQRGVSGVHPSERSLQGRYLTDDRIGVGGMATIYRCRDLWSGVDVAAKRMLADGTDPTIIQGCFEAETFALSVMDHDNIVRLREFGNDWGGAPYLILDLVQGVALNRIPAMDIPYPVLWSLIDQLLSALVHVHERGIVHGDLTPANVLVEDTPTGPRIRLIDFGLCWHFGQSLTGQPLTCPPLSGPPAGCGTLGYMAPEQLRGDIGAIGPWTDLYSVGAILHRLLAGFRPRTSGARSIRCLLPVERPARPTPLRMDVPTTVVDFAMQLLELDPERRGGSSPEVRARWQHQQPTEPCPQVCLSRVATPSDAPTGEPTTRVERPRCSPLFPSIAAIAGW
jgi:serine/threonine protein kinase